MNQEPSQVLSFIASQLKLEVLDGEVPYVLIDTATAFEFSSFTGATYLDNSVFPFCPRPHIKLFDKPYALRLATGMFENGVSISSVEQMVKMYPIVTAKKFKLVVCSFDSESEWRRQVDRLIQNQSEAEPYIALRLETSKKGWGLEPLLEWGFAMELKALGLVSDSQIPLGASVGTPDAQGFASVFSRRFIESITIGRFSTLSIPEILGYQFFGPAMTSHGAWILDSIVVVGEAKTGGSSAAIQLQKYMDSGFPDQVFFLSDAKSSSNNYGCYLTDNFRLNPKVTLESELTNRNAEYLDWLEITLISSHFASLPFESQTWMLNCLEVKDPMRLPAVLSQYGKNDIMELLNELGQRNGNVKG
jgi:hypothetical protein